MKADALVIGGGITCPCGTLATWNKYTPIGENVATVICIGCGEPAIVESLTFEELEARHSSAIGQV